MEEVSKIISEILTRKNKNYITVLTGAGISAASGIPTYRGTDGIWIKGTEFHKPEVFGTLRFFLQHPEKVWQYTLFRKQMMEKALPNSGHVALYKFEEKLGNTFNIITQNTDNLHRKVGHSNLFEIHGNYREVLCSLNCDIVLPFPPEVKSKGIDEDLTPQEIEMLKCPECGHWLRPNILWFDETYSNKRHHFREVLKIAKNSGLLFVIGTSGSTNIPLELVKTTLKYGGYVINVNIENNAFSNTISSYKKGLFLKADSSTFLHETLTIINAIRRS